MKIFKKVLGAVASFATVVAPLVVSGAAGAVVTPTSPASPNEKTTITKEIHNVTNPVNNTFSYTVAQVTNSEFPDLPTATGAPSSFTITFNGSETITSNTASKTFDLDFSSAVFAQVGDYKFEIAETSSSNQSMYPKDNDVWYAYVSVRNVLDSNNHPTGELVATVAGSGTENTDAIAQKAPILFETNASFTHIELTNDVTGNLADTDKYFKFEITFTSGVTDGDELVITGEHKTTAGGAAVSTSTQTVTGSKITVYLKDGQNVTIGSSNGVDQIAIGAVYTITVSDVDQYDTYIDGSTSAATTAGPKTTVAADDTDYGTDNNVTNFVNDWDADPITGIFFNYWPFMLLIALGLTGAFVFKKASKKVNK